MIKFAKEKSLMTQKNIELATEILPCSFDEILLESIDKLINIDSIRNQLEDPQNRNEFRTRFAFEKQERLKLLHGNQVQESLHEGFQKMCGLKGHKLSGG